MISCRIPIFLAAFMTCLGLSPSYSQSFQANYLSLSNVSIVAQSANQVDYKKYLAEGETAKRKKDYIKAWQSFKQAVAVNTTNDEQAKKSLVAVQAYAFDAFMQAGYAADKKRDYPKALKSFKQALEIRPDSDAARRAVDNVRKYLGNNNNNNLESKFKLSSSSALLIGGFSLCALVVGGAVFLLVKQSGNEGEKKSDSSKNNSQNNGHNYNNNSHKNNGKVTSYLHANKEEIEVDLPEPYVPADEDLTITQTVAVPSENIQVSSSIVSQTNGEIVNGRVEQTTYSMAQNGAIARVDIITELIQDLRQPDLVRRKKAIWELAQRSDSRAMKPLVDLLVQADSQERSLILEAIAQIATRTLKIMNKALSISLEDENGQVRKNAIRDLTKVYELISQVNHRLSHCLDDPDIEVRETARWALRQLNQIPKPPNLEDR